MIKYQNPTFSKEDYWRQRKAIADLKPEQRKDFNRAMKARNVVAVHKPEATPAKSDKPVTKKAILKNSKRARKVSNVDS